MGSIEGIFVAHMLMPHAHAAEGECTVQTFTASAVPRVNEYIDDRRIVKVTWHSLPGVHFGSDTHIPTIWSHPPHEHEWFEITSNYEMCKGCSLARVNGEEKYFSTGDTI